MISNVTPVEQRQIFFSELSERFQNEGQPEKAYIMNILSKDFDNIIKYQISVLDGFKINNRKRKRALITILERLLVLSTLKSDISSNAQFCRIVLEFAEMLVRN